MTDEQWLWLYLNMEIDNDELFESMCPRCQEEAKNSNKKCSRCGKSINTGEAFVNPNFNKDRFDKMANEAI